MSAANHLGFNKGDIIEIIATGERGTVQNLVSAYSSVYRLEMSDGTLALYNSTDLRLAQPKNPSIACQIALETTTDILSELFPKSTERLAWEALRDTLLSEYEQAKKDLAALEKSEDAYRMVRDIYFRNIAQAHRRITRYAASLSRHYANQPTR